MAIAGIESITGPPLPGQATWAEIIYVRSLLPSEDQPRSHPTPPTPGFQAHALADPATQHTGLGNPDPLIQYPTTPTARRPQLTREPIILNPPTPDIVSANLIIHRELLNPLIGLTIRVAASSLGYDPGAVIPFARDWPTGYLQLMQLSDILLDNLTVVLVDGFILGGTSRLIQILNELPQIMPLRMVWPIWPSNHPRPLPLPKFNPLPSLHPVPGS